MSEQEKPMYLLINSPRLFDKLLELFANPTPATSNLVWELLENLPLSNFYKTNFEEISIDNNNWKDYLKIKDYGRLVYAIYALSAVQEKILKDSPNKFIEFNNKLKNNKGYDFVLETFNESIGQIDQKMRIKCFHFALKILNVTMEHGELLYPDLSSQKEMWNKIKTVLKGILTSSFAVHLEAKEKNEIIHQCVKHQILLTKLNNAELYTLFLTEEYLALFVQGYFNYHLLELLGGEKNGKVSDNILLIWNEIIQPNNKATQAESSFAELLLKENLIKAIENDSNEFFDLLALLVVI